MQQPTTTDGIAAVDGPAGVTGFGQCPGLATSIRDADRDDYRRVLSLATACMGEAACGLVRNAFAHDDGFITLAELPSGILAGMALGLHHQHPSDWRSKLHLSLVCVDPIYRRQGVGARLMKQIRDDADLLNCGVIGLHVEESNVAAQLFYRSQGFLAVGKPKKGYYGTSDAYLMEFRNPLASAASC